jgi:Flp pilus assembly pilin Flp
MDAYASLRHREEGQGMTEYAVVLSIVVLLGAGIAVLISGALQTKITSIFSSF